MARYRGESERSRVGRRETRRRNAPAQRRSATSQRQRTREGLQPTPAVAAPVQASGATSTRRTRPRRRRTRTTAGSSQADQPNGEPTRAQARRRTARLKLNKSEEPWRLKPVTLVSVHQVFGKRPKLSEVIWSSTVATSAREKAMMKFVAARMAMELENSASNLVAKTDGNNTTVPIDVDDT